MEEEEDEEEEHEQEEEEEEEEEGEVNFRKKLPKIYLACLLPGSAAVRFT